MGRVSCLTALVLAACSPAPTQGQLPIDAAIAEPGPLLASCPDCPTYDDAALTEGDDATMPGPNSSGARDRARLDANDECRNCHGEVAVDWAGSAHATAFDDPMVRAAFARERESKFCQGCHAPESDLAALPSDRAAAIGVGCVSCHLDLDGHTVLAGPGPDTRAPHPLRRSERFAGPDACAACHEFGFPDDRADPTLLMQRTISEHQASDAAERSCQSCHMPRGSHRFPVDAALLASAASIVAQRSATELIITFEPKALGHAFPTGDLFRRLTVTVSGQSGEWTEQKYLARRFDIREIATKPVKVETADERVAARPGPTRVVFELPAQLREQPLRWSVDWERVLETPIGSATDAEVWDRLEVSSGSSPPQNPGP